MKRNIALMLALVLALCALAGCAAKPTVSDGSEASAGGAALDGLWIARSDPSFTMEFSGDTITNADGSTMTFGFEGGVITFHTADGDIEGVYDEAADAISIGSEDVEVTYLRAAK